MTQTTHNRTSPFNRAPPTVGAATTTERLDELAGWLIEGRRDLEIQDASQPAVLDGDWRARVRRVRDTLGNYGGRLGIHGPFDGMALLSRDPAVREVVHRRLGQGLEFAATLGATHMVVHSPFQFFGHPFTPSHPASLRAALIDLAHAALAPIAQLAEQSGVALALENIFDTNPVLLLDLARSFDSAYVRLCVDVGHAFITHRSGGAAPDQWVRDAGNLLMHLHIHDNDGLADRHWAPGDGNLNWYALFEALSALGHSPRLVIEAPASRLVLRGADYFTGRGLAV
jgi:sugar phosphate isomerase/epimerase